MIYDMETLQLREEWRP